MSAMDADTREARWVDDGVVNTEGPGRGAARVGAGARWRAALLVAAGGALGTLARYGLVLAMPEDAEWPVAIAIANLVGAFILGWLTAWLSGHVADAAVRQRRQLLLGTGVLGGFTTYSALAVDTAELIQDGAWSIVATYSLGTVILGTAACMIGLLLGTHRPAAARAASEVQPADASTPRRHSSVDQPTDQHSSDQGGGA